MNCLNSLRNQAWRHILVITVLGGRGKDKQICESEVSLSTQSEFMVSQHKRLKIKQSKTNKQTNPTPKTSNSFLSFFFFFRAGYIPVVMQPPSQQFQTRRTWSKGVSSSPGVRGQLVQYGKSPPKPSRPKTTIRIPRYDLNKDSQAIIPLSFSLARANSFFLPS